MQTVFIIEKPKHKQYKLGKIHFDFDDKEQTLKKLNFYIDNDYYYIPMQFSMSRTVSSTWIFQKQLSLTSLTTEELEKMVLLTKDVLDIYAMPESFKNLLVAVESQAKLYDQIAHGNLTKHEKSIYSKKLMSNKKVIIDVNKTRYIYFNKPEPLRNYKELPDKNPHFERLIKKELE